MRLKSVKLLGFKSFADRTLLEFGAGVSVVVGPNGTGKSNIVDAVSWVLGTQFTRALRADQMDDVVFAGTADRPAHSRAEVTLVMDNTDRSVPLNLDEVAVTRRLFKGGTSEYEINGAPCRLLDIQELLSDSGLGRRQHLIVSQGRLDTVLGGSPAQRREIIEDAAGIRKHRIRKAKAIRRLEQSDADAVRLRDIAGEMERRKRPLRKQVRDAERHEELRSELRSLRLWLGGEEFRVLSRRKRELGRERSGIERQIARGESEQGRIREMIETTEHRSERLLAELDRYGEQIADLRTVAARLGGVARVAHERAGGLADRIGEMESGYRRLTDQAVELSAQLDSATIREEQARQDAERCDAELQMAEARLGEMPAEGDLRAGNRTEMVRSALRKSEVAARKDADRIAEYLRAADEARSRLSQQSRLADQLAGEVESVEERLDSSGRLGRARGKDRHRRESEWARSEQRLRSVETREAAARARLEALAARSGASSRARDRIKVSDGVLGELIELLDVPEPLLRPVAAALGAWAEAMVVDSPETVGAVVAGIKTGGNGAVPLVVPEADPGASVARSVADRWGVKRLGDQLGPVARSGVAAGLLGDVLLVDSWSQGWEIVRKAPEVRAVTSEGDLITRFGVYPTDPDAGSPDMVAAARRAAESAGREMEAAREAEAEARVRMEAARRDDESARAEATALRSRHEDLTGALERNRRAQTALTEELARLEERTAAARRSAERTGRRLAELRDLVAEAEAGEASGRDSGEILVGQRAAAESRLAEARAAREESVRVLAAAAERRRLMADRVDSVTVRLADGVDTTTEQAGLERARNIERWTLRVAEVARHRLGELVELREQSRAMATASTGEVNALRTRAEALDREQESARSRLGRLEIAVAEVGMREESVAERLRRDADSTREEALAAGLPPEQRPGAEPRVEELTRALARMGPINRLAAEEYRELDLRYRHLTEQMADIEQARSEIRKAIDALDTEMDELFRTTFEDTARHYRDCFSVLFPGGSGELMLTGSADPLEAGVEIRAQPFGKKVGKLSLLSGGERSLAALAFLFAVFKARPGPFHILDEVDAALDEANLGRFLRLVEDFRACSQLVLITHQQATVRVADTLYGVTMAPGGSSRALVRDMNRLPAGTVSAA
ncbi:MAG: chromosome segregation protein SMC [bacterium]|nr:chromosome segregation protein SMC [bacterium]MDE0353613.1 chromosome segregation protein SMC [bacterium]